MVTTLAKFERALCYLKCAKNYIYAAWEKIVLVKRGLSLSLVLAFCLFSVSDMFHKLEITAGFLGG